MTQGMSPRWRDPNRKRISDAKYASNRAQAFRMLWVAAGLAVVIAVVVVVCSAVTV